MKLKTAQASLAASERDLIFLTETEIPAQVKEVASLQAVKVLRGDYDLKITRQDYFTSNQNQVVCNILSLNNMVLLSYLLI